MGIRRNVDNETIFRAAKDGMLTRSFLVLMASSGVLAALAFATGSIPLLLGAMIVAPMMAPLGLFIVGISGGQERLGLRGLGTALVGLLVAAGCTALTAILLKYVGLIEGESALLTEPLLEERVRPGWYSLLAAIAAGVAGTIGFHRGKTDTIIGTVASVALVPAAGAAGIALALGDPLRALGGAALAGINLLTIIAVGIVVTLALAPRRKPSPPASSGEAS